MNFLIFASILWIISSKSTSKKKKIVLNIFKYLEELIKLNNKLPEEKYDEEFINQIKKPIQKYFLSPHQILPKIKTNTKDMKENEEAKKNINDNNKNDKNKKSIFRNNIEINESLSMNTIKMKINRKHPFNYKGEIDIIIEE